MVVTSQLDPWISLVSFPPPQEVSRSESQQLLADPPCSEVGKTRLLCVPRSPFYARHHMGKHCSSRLTDQKAEIQSPGIALQSHREMKQVHMQVRMTTEPMPIVLPDVIFDSSRCYDSLDLGISGSSHRFQVLPFQFGFRR